MTYSAPGVRKKLHIWWWDALLPKSQMLNMMSFSFFILSSAMSISNSSFVDFVPVNIFALCSVFLLFN